MIYKLNKWYDKLPTIKRDLIFLFFIFGSLLFVQYLTYVENNYYAFIIWVVFWSLIRLPYILRNKNN